MYFDAVSLVDFCAKHKINPNQYLVLYLVYFQHGSNTMQAAAYKLLQESVAWSQEELDELVTLGYVDNKNKRGEFYMDSYNVTPKIRNILVRSTDLWTEELWENYPAQLETTDGSKFPARTIGPEELDPIYKKSAKNEEVHKEILAELIKQRTTNTLTCGIEKWVRGRMWIPGPESVSKSSTVGRAV